MIKIVYRAFDTEIFNLYLIIKMPENSAKPFIRLIKLFKYLRIKFIQILN